MLSTAWSRTDPFWTAWTSDDPNWIRLKATADTDLNLFPAEFLKSERQALGERDFNREFLAFLAVIKPVRSVGICMTERPRSVCQRCRQGAPSAQRRNNKPLPSPIRFAIFSQWEYDNDVTSVQHATAIYPG